MGERSSPSRTAGVVVREVTLRGETYLLSQPTKVRKAADEEAFVISRRLSMLPAIAEACAGLSLDQQERWRNGYIAHMTCGIATPEEWNAYFRSLWKHAFNFWCALDPRHKIIPGDPGDPIARRPATEPRTMSLLEGVVWVYELLSAAMQEGGTDFEEAKLAIRIVSQEDALGESSGSGA